MSYQSFPWTQGDSVSPAKLIALDLPRLEGKSVLDVGCNVLNCAAVTFKIYLSGLLGDLCEIIRSAAGDRDFILDMYVSPPGREMMRAWWEAKGFFVVDVALYNSRSQPHEKVATNAEENCRRYLEYLQKDFLVNEDDYLAANPDVALAIEQGRIPNAQYHYWNFGRKEGRPLAPGKPRCRAKRIF